MATANTLFMTPEESLRVQASVRDGVQKRRDQAGRPREPSDPKSLIQQAVSSSLMQELATTAFGMGAPKPSSDSMVAYAVGCPYPPCVATLLELEAIKLSELRMETHHRGRVLTVRRVSPVVELKASSWAVMKDESSDGVERLEVFLHKTRHGHDFLDSGSEFLIKEPYYTLNNQGEPTIRIDHPSDLVISMFSYYPESWRSVTASSAGATVVDPAKCKEEGNAALQKAEYSKAHSHYTHGLEQIHKDAKADETLRRDLYRNRAHVNLRLQRHDEARDDALRSLIRGRDREQKVLDAKAYYRAGSAAYSLGDFEGAKGYFEQQQRLDPDNQTAQFNLRRTTMRVQERETGVYALKRVADGLAKTSGRADVASFNGDTEIRDSSGAGRGLFSTRDMEADEIIMAEKAFCVVWSREAEALSVLTCDLRDDAAIRVFPAGLHKAVVQKLLDNPSQAEKVLDLFGDYKGCGTEPRDGDGDGSRAIDTFQIHDIVQRNAFGPGRQTENEDISNASTGLWIRAAYINHSCVANAKKEYIGDLMLLRATRRIALGDEITHRYDESSDYDARMAALGRTWGFKCHCRLCAVNEAEGVDVRSRRRELEKEANDFARGEKAPQARAVKVAKARRLRQSLNNTYDEKRYEGLPRLALLGIEQWLQLAPKK